MAEQDGMSQHIVVSLAILLSILLTCLLIHRIHNRRNAQLPSQPPTPSQVRVFYHPDAPNPQWIHSDVVLSIAPDSSPNMRRHSEYEGGTPSVWGIDLERGRGTRGPIVFPTVVLRGGAIARPAGGVIGSRRGLYDEAGASTEVLDLPRYEEPPPGYEKVIEEGLGLAGNPRGAVGNAHVGETSTGEGRNVAASDSGGNFQNSNPGVTAENVGHQSTTVHNTTSSPQTPALPSPAVTIERPER